MTSQRMFGLLSLLTLFLAFGFTCHPGNVPPDTMGWEQRDVILGRIHPPVFPDRQINVTKFGALGDGSTNCTDAIRRAIEDCNKSGGGRVVVPAGTFATGAIHLLSNVELHLDSGAVLRFSTEPAAYLPVVSTRWEGVECMNYSSLIYAYGQENIAVTGSGLLDGQGSAEHWWPWKGTSKPVDGSSAPNQNAGRKRLIEWGEKGTPVEQRILGEGANMRPNFIQTYKCKNVLISGVTLKNSPMWFIHPVLSSNVTVSGVTVEGLGPNNDGCDPESCTDVLIENCNFNTGDDCIAIKSGRNADGRRVNVPTENVVIRNCRMKEGHGGVVLGSEISGGVRNVFAEDCVMDSPNLDRALRFKTNSVRGGFIENFFARKITVGQVAEAVVKVDFYYEEGDAGSFAPSMRNVMLSDITCERGVFAIWMKGYERSPISDVRMERCTFRGIQKPNVLDHVVRLTAEGVTINGEPMASLPGTK